MKIVLFDLDGTISDTLPMCISTFRKAAEPYLGQELTMEEMEQAFGLDEEGMMKRIVGTHWQEALQDFYTNYAEMHTLCPTPFDGIRQLIHQLKKEGILIALVTGKGKITTEISLDYWNMRQDFDFIETGSPYKNRKAEAIGNILHNSHIAHQDAVYIGDTVSDVLSCREAGIVCLSATWSKGTKLKELENINPNHIIRNIADLKRTLLNRKLKSEISK